MFNIQPWYSAVSASQHQFIPQKCPASEFCLLPMGDGHKHKNQLWKMYAKRQSDLGGHAEVTRRCLERRCQAGERTGSPTSIMLGPNHWPSQRSDLKVVVMAGAGAEGKKGLAGGYSVMLEGTL